jgi:hypothetical protein
LVVEHYDRICILHAVSPRSGYVTTRVWFERNGTIYGEHNLCDAYRSVGGPHFCLAWTEWDTCYRRVYAPQAVETWVEGEIDDGLWWAMGRQMRPLAAPGAAP